MTKTVFWNGQGLYLLLDELQLLIDRAYQAIYEQNPDFQQALLDTRTEELTHTIGKHEYVVKSSTPNLWYNEDIPQKD